MKKSFCFLFFVIFFACKDTKKVTNTVNDSEQIIHYNKDFQFASEEADRLNEEAINSGRNGANEKAKELLLKALKIEPNNPITLNNLGIVYEQLKKYKQAISYFERSLKVSDSTYLTAGIGLTSNYYRISEYQKGIDLANYMIEKSKEKRVSIPASVHKAFCLISLGQCKKAKDELAFVKNNIAEMDNLQEYINSVEFQLKNCTQKNLQN